MTELAPPLAALPLLMLAMLPVRRWPRCRSVMAIAAGFLIIASQMEILSGVFYVSFSPASSRDFWANTRFVWPEVLASASFGCVLIAAVRASGDVRRLRRSIARLLFLLGFVSSLSVFWNLVSYFERFKIDDNPLGIFGVDFDMPRFEGVWLLVNCFLGPWLLITAVWTSRTWLPWRPMLLLASLGLGIVPALYIGLAAPAIFELANETRRTWSLGNGGGRVNELFSFFGMLLHLLLPSLLAVAFAAYALTVPWRLRDPSPRSLDAAADERR